MSWVYWDPKSSINILSLWMSDTYLLLLTWGNNAYYRMMERYVNL